jgi:hypothetical protein
MTNFNIQASKMLKNKGLTVKKLTEILGVYSYNYVSKCLKEEKPPLSFITKLKQSFPDEAIESWLAEPVNLIEEARAPYETFLTPLELISRLEKDLILLKEKLKSHITATNEG